MKKRAARHVTLTLSPENPLNAAAWRVISAVPKGKRTEYICRVLTEHERAEELAAVVYRSAVRALDEYGGTMQKPNNMTQGDSDEAGEIEQNFLGFLSALQGGDGF